MTPVQGDAVVQAAATRLQALVRGRRARAQQRRVVAGVTKLQAQQRGRFTRRAFAQLQAFAREQERFLQAARHRQLRIARHEQELFFLQRTSAATLERIREFQRQRAARAIQRTWRHGGGGAAAALASAAATEPPDAVLGFDPFGLGAHTGGGSDGSSDGGSDGGSPAVRELEDALLGPLFPSPLVASNLDRDTFMRRRQDAHGRCVRIRQLVQSRKPTAAATLSLSPLAQPNRRRELYDQLRQSQALTARRVGELERTSRATRTARELANAKLAASCANRLKGLQAPALPPFCVSESDPTAGDATQLLASQTARFAAETELWDADRKAAAWRDHSCLVHTTLRKAKWWQTSVAGCEVDIRRVHARSPWDHERQVWSWPAARDVPSAPVVASEPEPHAREIDEFVFSLQPGASAAAPLPDVAASEWWRAHCLQPHLPPHAGVECEANDDDSRSRWSAEALANPVFHRLFVASKRRAAAQEIALAGHVAAERFEKHVSQRVCELETQVELNTKLQQDVAERRQQLLARRSREERAAVSIQRVCRGAHSRRRAREVRAEFFVVVRGRAVRKGRCEECGEQQAVLECRECEESLHFCPVCWVQVHATRRRKPHRAIPISVALAPQSGADRPPKLSPPSTALRGATRAELKSSVSRAEEERDQHWKPQVPAVTA
ncbi:hypothetical protein PybrP1_007168, partial [[Pythium] brassicae (nom. inval.)]